MGVELLFSLLKCLLLRFSLEAVSYCYLEMSVLKTLKTWVHTTKLHAPALSMYIIHVVVCIHVYVYVGVNHLSLPSSCSFPSHSLTFKSIHSTIILFMMLTWRVLIKSQLTNNDYRFQIRPGGNWGSLLSRTNVYWYCIVIRLDE